MAKKTETVGLRLHGRKTNTQFFEVDSEGGLVSRHPSPKRPGQMRVSRMESAQETDPRGRTMGVSKVPNTRKRKKKSK